MRGIDHIRAVPSADAVTTLAPSGLKLAELTTSVCPSRTIRGWPSWARQTRAVLSCEAERMQEPSRLKATFQIGLDSSWPLSVTREASDPACQTSAFPATPP